ncbi:MAG: outer membrane lipoprotein carrier protein LolA [Verrucomicrobiales bacterium]|nr:outer membrane lipoprotein carrier protein LolA [Verrucomicrobiales bacterium]
MNRLFFGRATSPRAPHSRIGALGEVALPGRHGLWRLPLRSVGLLLVLGSLLAVVGTSRAATPSPATLSVLDAWFTAQAGLKTWSAEVHQTRWLPTLTQPLTSTGQVWVALPDQFRWELGRPAQTIAIRSAAELVLQYPRLKRAERYPLKAAAGAPWREALALLEAGFPTRRDALVDRFEIGEPIRTNGLYLLVLTPRNPGTRKLLTEIAIRLDTNSYSLAGTEVTFADGMRMRSDFISPVANPPLENALFDSAIDPSYKVTQPLGP